MRETATSREPLSTYIGRVANKSIIIYEPGCFCCGDVGVFRIYFVVLFEKIWEIAVPRGRRVYRLRLILVCVCMSGIYWKSFQRFLRNADVLLNQFFQRMTVGNIYIFRKFHIIKSSCYIQFNLSIENGLLKLNLML